MSGAGTRRSDLQRKKRVPRKKPAPVWVHRWGWIGAAAGVVLILFGTVYWLASSGWVSQQIGRAERSFVAHSAEIGLAVRDVYVAGRGETRQQDVLSAMMVRDGQPILLFDPHLAQAELESLPWVRSARVERRFPSTVIVSLIEREPIGILQRGGQQALVDETGTVLTTQNLQRWKDLPVLVGNGAPQAAPELIRALVVFPDLYWRVRAMTFIYQRRWDLLLDNAVTVRLPEEDIDTALARLDRAQKEAHVLDGAARIIDLRLSDRMILEPVATPSGHKGI